jgi:hypothetical protein
VNVDRDTAQNVLHLWPNPADKPPPGGYAAPSEADRLLYLTASVLEGVDLDRLNLVFPKHVAAVQLLRKVDGRDVLRALAVAGV